MGLSGAIRGAGLSMSTAIAIQEVGVIGGAGAAAYGENDRVHGKLRAGVGVLVSNVLEELLGGNATSATISGAIGGVVGIDPVTGAIGGAVGGFVSSITAKMLAEGNECVKGDGK